MGRGIHSSHGLREESLRRREMILRTIEQVRRVFRMVTGFTLLAAGAVMLVTPGPGWLTIFLGLGLLAAEFMWARRLMARIKREGGRVRDAVGWQPRGRTNGTVNTKTPLR